MLSFILYYVYLLTFFHIQISIRNRQIRSDLKMPLEIAFVHRWELHATRKAIVACVLKLFSFGIQIIRQFLSCQLFRKF
jgi:hypothetical protein